MAESHKSKNQGKASVIRDVLWPLSEESLRRGSCSAGGALHPWGTWGGEFDFISLAVAPPPLILPGAEERKEKKLRVGNRGTERSALQSPQTGNIVKDKTTHKHEYRDTDTCKYVLYKLLFIGGSTFHGLHQVFEQKEFFHLWQWKLHWFSLALALPPARPPPGVPHACHLLLHHLRPQAQT